jgi:enolase
MNSRIQAIHAREIFDSRGNPTFEVDVTLSGDAPRDRKPPMGQNSWPEAGSSARKSDYEANVDVEVGYVIPWSPPFTGGRSVT